MDSIGIICEYNPLHRGHEKQLAAVRSRFPESGVICLMSGNFVQRGEPAILDKQLRVEAALACGADLVLEMPVTGSLSSAEGFAGRGVEILSTLCSRLCFGAESGMADTLMDTARALLSPEFSGHLRAALDTGVSFPKARQMALENMGKNADLLVRPNDILAVEYCKAILSQDVRMEPYPVRRRGDYHDTQGSSENPSATAVRNRMTAGEDWEELVPPTAAKLFQNAPLHRLENGEKAILYRLRTMTEEEFAALPYGSEGLWRKLMHAARSANTLRQVMESVKSKRYTYTRIARMVMCAFLGVSEELLTAPVPYVRVLALNETGGRVLRDAGKPGMLLNAGQRPPDCPYADLERRSEALFGLFGDGSAAPKRRVIVK